MLEMTNGVSAIAAVDDRQRTKPLRSDIDVPFPDGDEGAPAGPFFIPPAASFPLRGTSRNMRHDRLALLHRNKQVSQRLRNEAISAIVSAADTNCQNSTGAR